MSLLWGYYMDNEPFQHDLFLRRKPEELARPAPEKAPEPWFDGETFEPDLDISRLGRQMAEVAKCMADGAWRTLEELALATGNPEASVSARLRDLRKDRWGSWVVLRRRRGDAARGLNEYRVVPGLRTQDIGGDGP
jgi:hypothetical protein